VQEHLSEIQKGGTQEILIASRKLVLHLAKMLQINNEKMKETEGKEVKNFGYE